MRYSISWSGQNVSFEVKKKDEQKGAVKGSFSMRSANSWQGRNVCFEVKKNGEEKFDV